MKNVLIINGHQKYDAVAEGKLTQMFIDKANEFAKNSGYNVKNTVVESDYDITKETKKLQWADYIIFQYPVYWMGVPWITKKYIDEVFIEGVAYTSDGRSSKDSSKRYGTGGLLGGKKYMLSLTYNCPTSEFSNKDGFFDGLSLDEAHVAVHKTFQFCGATPMKTYSVHDIFKGNLDMDIEIENFEKVLYNNL